MKCHTKVGNITTNIKVKVDFTLPILSATYFVTWNCHVDDSAKVRYDMILGRVLLIEFEFNSKLSDHIIESNSWPFKGSTAPMVDLGAYELKNLNTGEITPAESFTNAYADEVDEW